MIEKTEDGARKPTMSRNFLRRSVALAAIGTLTLGAAVAYGVSRLQEGAGGAGRTGPSMPADLCAFIGADVLEAEIPNAELERDQGDVGLLTSCRAVSPIESGGHGEPVSVRFTLIGGSARLRPSEEDARRRFEEQCAKRESELLDAGFVRVAAPGTIGQNSCAFVKKPDENKFTTVSLVALAGPYVLDVRYGRTATEASEAVRVASGLASLVIAKLGV